MVDSAKASQVRFPAREAKDTVEYLEDVGRVLELPREVRAALVAALYAFDASDDAADAPDFPALRKAGLRWMDVYQALRALDWLTDELDADGTSWLHECLDGQGDPQRATAIDALVAELRGGRSSHVRRVQAALADAEAGATPAFADIVATSELRGLFIEGTGSSGDALVGLLPVASIRLDLDSGTPRSISFQASYPDVVDIIKELEVVRQRLKTMGKHARATTQSTIHRPSGAILLEEDEGR